MLGLREHLLWEVREWFVAVMMRVGDGGWGLDAEGGWWMVDGVGVGAGRGDGRGGEMLVFGVEWVVPFVLTFGN